MEPAALLSVEAVVGGYVCGLIPTGVWLTRGAGIDLRHQGSGNVGATNVLRTAGARLGALTLAGDAVKGALPTLLAWGMSHDPATAATAGVCSVIGHCYPVTARFAGGKGVATALGVLLVLSPLAAATAITVFGLLVWSSGYVSVGSLAGAAAAPLVGAMVGEPVGVVVAATLMAALIWGRHRDNLARLLTNREPKIRAPNK